MQEFIKRITTGLILAGSLLLLFFCSKPLTLSIILIGILFYILLFEWPHLNPWKHAAGTALYPTAPFLMLIWLNQAGESYRWHLFVLFLAVSLFDSASYCAGKLFGMHKLVPWLSPGKTWEGALGGFLALTMALIFLKPASTIFGNSMLALATGISALAGDLFVSYLKRRAHLKDTGSILPGHGGFLDRLDSLLCAVILWFFLAMFRIL